MFTIAISAEIKDIVLPGSIPVGNGVKCATLRRYLSLAARVVNAGESCNARTV
jgi:hypothetical protein